MTLTEYIKRHFDGNVAAAARDAGMCREKMRLWATKGIIPRPEAIEQLRQWSGGAVEPNSFYRSSEKLTEINACEPQAAGEVKVFQGRAGGSVVMQHVSREVQHA